MKKIYQVVYNIGRIERTCVVMADNRIHAQTLVANTEPADVTIFILSCEHCDDDTVFQMLERRAEV